MLDKTSKQRLQRHIQKLANATQLSFAERALLREHNQFLTRINNEAKVRRSAKSKILGTARVMSYEDLEKARAERAAKEAEKAATGKKKRGRKRKSPTQEVDAPGSAEVEMQRISEAPVAEDAIATPQRKPKVARMI